MVVGTAGCGCTSHLDVKLGILSAGLSEEGQELPSSTVQRERLLGIVSAATRPIIRSQKEQSALVCDRFWCVVCCRNGHLSSTPIRENGRCS